jgi:hypothetical protein
MLPGVEAMQMQAAPPRQRAQRQTSSCLECRRRKQKVSGFNIHLSPSLLFFSRFYNETTLFYIRPYTTCSFDSFALSLSHSRSPIPNNWELISI